MVQNVGFAFVYEWCLCVLAHERVFAKPTHQLPGTEQTDGISIRNAPWL